MSDARSVVLFTSAPKHWRRAERLSRSVEEADQLYDCLLSDTIALARGLRGIDLTLCFTPEPGLAARLAEMAPEARLLPRSGEQAEAILHGGMQGALRAGRMVVALGLIAPHLPPWRVQDAFAHLEDGAEVVVGPAESGELFLLGLRGRGGEVIDDMPDRPEERLAHVRRRAIALELDLATLPPWYTISTTDDLTRLNDDLVAMPPSALPNLRSFFARGTYRERAVG